MTARIVNHTKRSARIENFSTARYLDPQLMEREWTDLWRRCWLLAGLESDVREPGDFFVFDIGREQVLVSRSRAGAVHGFYNVCQHRGNRLVTEERGQVRNFRCAYHAWTYDTDGTLKGVPYESRFAEGVPCSERSLRRVHADVWNGFVFISLAADPPPLLDYLGPVADLLAPYRFGEMLLVEDQTVHHRCNWKTVVDNFSELYHVDFIHPQHQRMVDCCNDTVHLFPNGHTGVVVPGATVNPRFPIPEEPTDIQAAQLRNLGLDPADFTGRVLEVREAMQRRKREIGSDMGIDYSAFADDQLTDVWQYNLFPNAILSFTPERCWVLRPRPHASDPQKCYFDKLTLLRLPDPQLRKEGAPSILGSGSSSLQSALECPGDHVRPQRDVFDHEAIVRGEKTMTETVDQDIALLAGVQAGMGSAGFDSVWLNDDEMRLQHFHSEWERLIPSAAH
jgi:phenylpropionate dioxygenase-like ring-hydroxylating dioxygenase large terminal subunit